MTVEEMLSRISARELSEWTAYEKSNGPLGHQYSDDMLAQINYAIQANTYVTGYQFEPNPAPEPKHVPRPHEVMTQDEDVQYGFEALAEAIPE